MTKFDRRIWWILAGLAALLIILVAAGRRFGQPDPLLNGASPGETVQVGAYGPLLLTLSSSVPMDSLKASIQLDPPVAGRYSWESEAQTASFWPEKPLIPGQRYTLRLQADQGQRVAKIWQVDVRQPELLYLAPSRAAELWQETADGKNPRQLTNTGGRVYDYTAAPDGSRILFSARNDQGGLDLWELERGAEEAVLLLPCGSDWCFEAVYSPDLKMIAYSRRTFSGIQGSAPGAPRLWLYDRAAQTTDALLADPELGGSSAAWSPDGRFLAFTDPHARVLRVVDFEEKTDFSVPAGAESRVVWAPSGSSFYMTKPENSEAFPYVLIYEVDTATRQARLWNGEKGLSQVDYSLPMPSPDGEWLAVSRRLIGGGPGKQLWIMHRDGSQTLAVSLDPLANYAGYQWDPTSRRLVFQRLPFSGSDSHPQVILWDRENGQRITIAEDAFLPRWLP